MSAIPYRVLGTGSLLIYIAGLDGTGELFFKQAQALASRYRVVTFRSREAGHFDYDDLSDDVAAIIRDAGEARAVVLGESFGGTVALNFALRHPSMVARLVIVNSFPRFRSRLRLKLATGLAASLPFGVVRPFRMAANLLGLYIDGVGKQDRRRFFEIIHNVRQEGYVRRLQLIAGFNVERRLEEITAPVLLIAGDRDIVVPSVAEARTMARAIPNSRLRIIPGAGHACLLSDRVNLADILDEWDRATEMARQDDA
jgi:pimeloyl-ACP methyl ester carboxylesterase